MQHFIIIFKNRLEFGRSRFKTLTTIHFTTVQQAKTQVLRIQLAFFIQECAGILCHCYLRKIFCGGYVLIAVYLFVCLSVCLLFA